MKLSYKVSKKQDVQTFAFPLGQASYRHLQLGSLTMNKSAQLSESQLSESQVLTILSEVVTQTNAKIKVEFENVTLEFE